MEVTLHANATTTPRTRRYIQTSKLSTAELAAELGVSVGTIRKWRGRTSVADRSHRPHELHSSVTGLNEQLVLELRTVLDLSLDDIVEVMHRCADPDLSRSAIHRTLQRHGVSARPPVPKDEPAKTFDTPEPGYVHIDLKHLTRLDGSPAYVFVAIERATRFVHIQIMPDRTAETVSGCLERFLAGFPLGVHTILTDNGSEFTDRFGGAHWHKREKGTGKHAFDLVCARHGIEHKLTRTYTPKTNGMVERFNRRLAEALRSAPANGTNAGRNKFASHDQRNAFLHAFVQNYNRTRLRCLDYNAPIQVLNNLTGDNTKAGISVYCRWRPRLLP